MCVHLSVPECTSSARDEQVTGAGNSATDSMTTLCSDHLWPKGLGSNKREERPTVKAVLATVANHHPRRTYRAL